MKPETDNSRRRFLQAGIVAVGAPLLLSACGGGANNAAAANLPGNAAVPKPVLPPASPKLGSLVGFGTTGEHKFIGVVDLDHDRAVSSQQDIAFLGHGLAPNPAKRHLAVISEKHGKGCVEWDMRARKVTRKLETTADREFYGHGAFTPDGKTLFMVETEVGDGSFSGVITVRDGDSYAVLGEFPSFGTAPHDVLLVDDGTTLVVTNGGGPAGSDDLPCVTYVDVKARSLKTKLTFNTPRINAGHLAMTSRGELAVVSAPREGLAGDNPTGAITFYSPGGEMRTAEDPVVKRMKLETLSVAIHEPSMIVAATNPAGNLVTFWDFKEARLVKIMDQFQAPRGISLTLDGRYFALTFDKATHAILIDAKTLEPVESTRVDQSFISGSHNYIYDMPV